MNKDSLGDRMKRFERTTTDFLMPRTPTIIRVDGKAFHTFTKRFPFPFSQTLHNIMGGTAGQLINECQNAEIAYWQSDEISILLNDWKSLESQQWFGGKIQKICSVSAAIATASFLYQYMQTTGMNEFDGMMHTLPKFDSRVFQMPKEEVCNYYIWRQQDATRNSVQMLARSKFSHQQCHGKNNSELQDMLMLEHGLNWNDLPTWMKRGACVVQNNTYDSRSPVVIDREIPIFTADREYINNHLQENE